MAKTTIEWATDVWNPVTGCSKVSEGCRNCYAEGIAKRFWGNRPFAEVRCHEDRLTEPLHWRKSRRVFVNSMSDLFHEDVAFKTIATIFGIMAACPQHTFIVLTKRPVNMLKFFDELTARADSKNMLDIFGNDSIDWRRRHILRAAALNATGDGKVATQDLAGWPLPNVWLGVTAENQQAADERIPLLLQTPAAVRFVSVEPMLGEVDLRKYLIAGMHYLDWAICGGESGSHARPMHPDWPRKLRDQCKEAGTPFMFKQWGEWLPNVYGDKSIPMNTDFNKTHCHFEDGTAMAKVGKKAAGRLLDGVEHNEYPEAMVELIDKVLED